MTTAQKKEEHEAAVCFLIAAAIVSIVAEDGKMAFREIAKNAKALKP